MYIVFILIERFLFNENPPIALENVQASLFLSKRARIRCQSLSEARPLFQKWQTRLIPMRMRAKRILLKHKSGSSHRRMDLATGQDASYKL